jgi:circadian clock protein KaiB
VSGSLAARPALTLFVSGASDLSARAITSARQICDVHLEGRYDLSVVDVYDDLASALTHRVLATPTLLKHRPAPERRYVGDLSHTNRVLLALELLVTKTAPTTSG